MISKQQVFQNGISGSHGLGSVVQRMSTGVQRGCFTYYFHEYEVRPEEYGILQQILSAAGWNASIAKERINEGDYTGSCWVDKVKVVLS